MPDPYTIVKLPSPPIMPILLMMPMMPMLPPAGIRVRHGRIIAKLTKKAVPIEIGTASLDMSGR